MPFSPDKRPIEVEPVLEVVKSKCQQCLALKMNRRHCGCREPMMGDGRRAAADPEAPAQPPTRGACSDAYMEGTRMTPEDINQEMRPQEDVEDRGIVSLPQKVRSSRNHIFKVGKGEFVVPV